MEKRGIETELIPWWIIAIVVLAIMLSAYWIMQAKGISAVEFIKNLFRFR